MVYASELLAHPVILVVHSDVQVVSLADANGEGQIVTPLGLVVCCIFTHIVLPVSVF